jgi:UDP-glucose 4-epimerase
MSLKILLTGATGYVGSEVLLELRSAGHEVWCLTRRIPDPSGDVGARVLMHDLRDPIPPLAVDFDLVVHAAGANDIVSRDPAAALATTTLSARHAAAFASQQRRPRLLYVSTVQVYGRDEGPVSEDTPCQPRNDYALTHLFAEEWVEQFGRTHGIAWVCVRPGNIAGVPRAGAMSRWTLAPGCFCDEAVRTGVIVVRSTGRQYRDFLPLADVARQIADVGSAFDDFAGGPVNVCSGASLTIREVADLAAERYRALYGRACEVQYRPPTDAAATMPQALALGSRIFDWRPAERLSHAAAVDRMVACIDSTYHHLERSA